MVENHVDSPPMGSRESAWLQGELPKWVADGILPAATAEVIARRYRPASAGGTPPAAWGQLILVGFGSLLVGGGLCLILAHNWDVLSRPMRAALVIGGLVLAQSLAAFGRFRRSESAAWIEATSAFLVGATGIALALVSQTYHIPGTTDSFYRAWLWLIVAIPYLTGSVLAALLLWVLVAVRAVDLAGTFSADGPPSIDPWLIAAAAFPFVVQAVRRRGSSWFTALVVWACAAGVFVLGIVTAIDSRWDGLWAVFAVPFFAALYAAASWPADAERDEAWRRRVGPPAAFGLLVTGIILSFEATWRHINVQAHVASGRGALAVGVIAAACVACASVLAVRLWIGGKRHVALWAAGAPLIAVAHGIALAKNSAFPWLAFNLWLGAAGIASLMSGVRENRFSVANQGLVALALVIGARFFDVELSFLARGVGFVALGVGCLATNLLLIRRARRTVA